MFHSINSYLKTQTDIDHMYIIYIYILCIYMCVCDAENLKLTICSWEKPQGYPNQKTFATGGFIGVFIIHVLK